LRILSFTGGAGQMYCGSCLRDNALASALMARGHDVVLTPVYTPTRTDERNVSHNRVAFGGISVFLEQYSSVFRHTPRMLDRLWDAEWVIKLASKRQIKVDPQSLGEMTVSMLRGDQGFQKKEIAKLLDWLKTESRFDVVNLPYTLLLGLAEPLKRTLGTPICCTLQGEDLFLDGLGEPWKQQSMDLIRKASAYVDAFLPVSQYYLDYMQGYLGIPREKMRLVPLGINTEGYSPRPIQRQEPFTIGYFARIAPEKGLHVLADAYRRLRTRPGIGKSRLVAAGYVAPEHQAYLDGITSDLNNWGLQGHFEYRGEVDRVQKIDFLRSLDVLSVPATYEEPKGIFLLEAMANAVPVVQPRRGAFPELVETTGGGLIVEADNPEALADGFQALWRDPARAAALGAAGAAGVRKYYSVDGMAESAEGVYRELIGSGGSTNTRGSRAQR
jgi:glycosyltransferase involved in cell wall biosynthesis